MLRNWKSSPNLAIIALLAVTAVWGWTFLGVKEAIAKMPVMDFLAVRFTVAAILLFIIKPTTLFRISRQVVWRGAILGFLLGMSYITQTFGLRTVSPAVSGFITGMGVVFTPVLLWAILKRKTGRNVWIAVLLALAGLALLSLHGWSFGIGELLTLGCAVFVAFHIIGLGEWSPKYDTYELTIIQIITVAIMCLIAAAPGGIMMPPDALTWGTIAITAILATAAAFFVQTWAQALMQPTYAALILTMEPVFAGIFSVTLGGDRLTIRIIIGAICVLAAMLIAQIKITRKMRHKRRGSLLSQ
jgi:drug/metabolite transporter (DMT)-like permease